MSQAIQSTSLSIKGFYDGGKLAFERYEYSDITFKNGRNRVI